MTERLFTDRLLDLCEYNAPQIAEGWYRDVSRNAKTPSYHALQKDDCVREAIAIYKNLKTLFFAVESFRQIQSVFGRYADLMYQKSIPLSEVIYALILTRRHIWLYAEFQALFNTALDMYQAVESVNRVVLIYDYAIYSVTQKYSELISGEKVMV